MTKNHVKAFISLMFVVMGAIALWVSSGDVNRLVETTADPVGATIILKLIFVTGFFVVVWGLWGFIQYGILKPEPNKSALVLEI